MPNAKKEKYNSRNKRGNVLVIGLLCFAAVAATFYAAYGLFNVFFVHNLLQGFADKVALSAACALNESDRLGDMNNLVAQARQLVFASREMSGNISSTDPDLQVLADQLLNEDRQNALALNQERTHLANVACSEAQSAVETALTDQTGIYRTFFPLLSIKTPQVVSVQFGNVSNIDSNVALLDGFEDLTVYDQSSKLINPSSNLYVGNSDAKLPAPDSDLDFNLSSLAAPINGALSPARMTLTSTIQPSDQNNQQLPSAVTVVISAQVANGKDIQQVVSAAATNGALPEE